MYAIRDAKDVLSRSQEAAALERRSLGIQVCLTRLVVRLEVLRQLRPATTGFRFCELSTSKEEQTL